MSNFGFEYGGGGFGGEFDPMGGFDTGGGGGYGMDAGNAGGFLSTGEPESKSSEKKKSGDHQSLILASVKQLLTADQLDDVFSVDGHELQTVQVMGTIMHIEEHSTNINFKLNDGSDILDCKHWIEKESLKHQQVVGMKDGTMVRVMGYMRGFEGRRHLLVFEVKPVEDFNELTHHILEVIYTHLKNTKGPVPGSASAVTGQAKAGGAYGMSSPAMGGMNANMGMNQNSMMTGGGASLNQSFANNDPGSITAKMLTIYGKRDKNSAEGLHVTEVMAELSKQGVHLSAQEVQAYANTMCEEGQLYTTLDDETHRPTTEEW